MIKDTIHNHLFSFEPTTIAVTINKHQVIATPTESGLWDVVCKDDDVIRYECKMRPRRIETALMSIIEADGRHFDVVRVRDRNGYFTGIDCTARTTVIQSKKTSSLIGRFLSKFDQN